MGLSDFWEGLAERWVRWARAPGHGSYCKADPELDVRRADAAALALEDGAADLVVSFMSLAVR